MRKRIFCSLLISLLTSAAIISGCGTTGIPEVSVNFPENGGVTEQETETENVETTEAVTADIPDITIEDIKEANSRDKIFSNHSNWLSEVKVSEDDSGIAVQAYELFGFTSFHENGISYFETDYLDDDMESHRYETSLFNGETDYYHNADLKKDQKLFAGWYAMSDDEKEDALKSKFGHPDCFTPFTYNEDIHETIDSVQDANDGTLTVITHIPTELCPEIKNLPDEWKGGKVRYTYTLDKETLEMSELVCEIVADGKTYEFLTQKDTYDVDTPEGYYKMCSLVYDYKNDEIKEPRTLTVIYDPDTDDEESFRMTVDYAYRIIPNIRKGYSLYKDPKGKIPFTGSSTENADVTMFAIKD
ncbi:MAG: hypothetical protein E7232_14445 [Lachnospiraceae bacterium]|jgi:hypothetical protein|nr:hypothetical protein [Lachnospiraceae bacterium]